MTTKGPLKNSLSTRAVAGPWGIVRTEGIDKTIHLIRIVLVFIEGSLNGERDITLTLTDRTITFAGVKPQGGIGGDCRSITVLVKGGTADGMTLVFTR